MTTLAIDIGGTKLAAGLVDEAGVLARRRQCSSPATSDAETMFTALASLIGDVVGESPIERCGVGCGGPMAEGGTTVSPLNIPAWRQFPLRARLAQLVDRPVYVDNDAKALALGEGWRGAARGVADYLAIVVSTGVGAGIVSRGRLLDGASGNAGHLGHVFVAEHTDPWPSHPAGLLETEASGTAIALRTGAPAAQASREVVERTGLLVGRAVASAANLLDLRLAVVAGSVALGFGAPFFRAAQTEIDRLCVLDFTRGTRIVPAGLGDEGPLLGAAAVALRAEGHDTGVA